VASPRVGTSHVAQRNSRGTTMSAMGKPSSSFVLNTRYAREYKCVHGDGRGRTVRRRKTEGTKRRWDKNPMLLMHTANEQFVRVKGLVGRF
jgi:hypothetical protein